MTDDDTNKAPMTEAEWQPRPRPERIANGGGIGITGKY